MVAALLAVLATAVAARSQSGGRGPRLIDDACAPTLADRAVSVFTRGAYAGVNHEVQGRVIALGDVSVNAMQIGTALSPNPDRDDLIAGGSIQADGTQVPNGSAIYGTTFSGQLIAPVGTVTRARASADLAEIYATDAELSEAWADLSANGTIEGPTYGQLQFVGDDDERNVFRISAADLQQAQRIQIRVPAGSTTLIDVTGSAYSSATLPSVSVELWNGSAYVQVGNEQGTDLDRIRERLVWNFAAARSLQIGPGIAWQGSILAPQADARLSGSTQIHGSVLAANVDDQATFFLRPFEGCLPPLEPEPQADLELLARCVDPVTNRVEMLVRNSGSADVAVTWEDELSAQSGAFVAEAQHDTWFEVEDAGQPHVIDLHAGRTTLSVRTPTDACAGALTVTKRVTGDGRPPGGRWSITVVGDNGYETRVALGDGESRRLVLPGSIESGSVNIGELPDGTRYVVREDDPRGATVSTSRNPVTITDGNAESVVVGNDYQATPEPPEPPEPPVEPVEPPVTPPVQPTLPPAVDDPGQGPPLSLPTDARPSADVAITEAIAPRRLLVGKVVTLRVRVVNHGPAAAAGVVARELPQLDPRHPNRIARVLSVRSPSGATCNSTRPVRCALGTLASGASRTLVIRARMLRVGSFDSVVYVSSTTADRNTSNNIDANGLVVREPTPALRAAISAPARVRVGEHVRYRVSAIGGAPRGARVVRVCHRPPAGLLIVRGVSGARRIGGQLCRDVPRLARGARTSFWVDAVVRASAAGRRVPLTAVADAIGLARVARARTAVDVIDLLPTGRG